MGDKCDVCGVRGRRIHRFPHEESLACTWAEVLGWEEEFDEMVLKKRHRSIQICSSHFHDDSYANGDRIKGKLKANQLPVKLTLKLTKI